LGIYATRSADAVKSPYYQAVPQRSSTLRYVLADLTETRAAAAYAALVEIERLAALVASAPGLNDRITLAEMIAQRYARFRDLLQRYAALDASEGMASAAPALDDARRRVESADWWEGLAVVALSAPLTDELFAALAGGDASSRPGSDGSGPAGPALDDVGPDSVTRWAADRLRAAIGEDPVLAARLMLWGRRLVGESIVLARVFGGERYRELAEQLATSHARRLDELGLAG
jgi:tRNA-(MS[2]IO[6]A)-hydroxylase MiaE-like protein